MTTERKEFIAIDISNKDFWLVLYDENENLTQEVKLTACDIKNLIAELQKIIGTEPKENKKW